MLLVGWEAVFFWILTLVVLFAAVFTVSARNPVHCALFLISTLIGMAGLFLLLRAEFVAGAQILVYVGGILVLFLFVLMLVNTRSEVENPFNRQDKLGAVIAVLVGLALLGATTYTQQRGSFFKTRPSADRMAIENARPDSNAPAGVISADTETLGVTLYTRAVLPFEIASVLLLMAIVGSVLLARDRRQEEIYD
jgi:NADH:ubiquinone oxidoreductase subunit 6 (chain J)